MAIHLGRPLPDASRDPPERRCENPSAAQSHRPFLFGLAPGGVYLAATVAGRAVRSYRTLSPLPADLSLQRVSAGRRFAFCGTFPGVAPAGRYPAPCFRRARTFLPLRVSLLQEVAIQPSDAVFIIVPEWWTAKAINNRDEFYPRDTRSKRAQEDYAERGRNSTHSIIKTA